MSTEVKRTSKKALSLLLAVLMVMTSMSVCFSTFSFTAAAADTDYTTQLADKLKDGAYSDTLGLLGQGAKGGSGLNRSTSITFANYRNFKQAAELLRLVDGAMKETAAWTKAVDFSTASGTDDKSACQGANTTDVYNGLIEELEKKGVTINDNVKTFIGCIYHMEGATAHTSPNGSSLSTWTNTITYSTTDYKGYLAQIGKAANVESSIEMGVQYVVQMQGNLYYEDGCDKKYHHQFWPKETAVNAPTTSATNTEAKSKVDTHISEINSFTGITYAQWLERAENNTIDNRVSEFETARTNAVSYVGSQPTYDALFADYAAAVANTYASVVSAKSFQDYMPTVNAWNDFVAANPNYGVFQYPDFGAAGSESQVKLVEDFVTFKAYRDYLLTGGSIYDYLVDYNYIDETYYTNFYDNVVAYDLQDSKDAADALYAQYSAVNPGMDETEIDLDTKTVVYNQFCGFINNISNYSAQVVAAVYTSGHQYLIDMREYFKCEINPAVLYFAENAYKTFTTMSTTALWNEINVAKGHQADLDALYNEVKGNAGQDKADQLLATLRADAAAMIENLYKTLADRFTSEVNAAWDVYVALGKPSTLKVDTFLQLSAVIVAIEASILTDLQAAGKAGYVTQTTIDRYNELNKEGGIIAIWNAYATTFGFPDYKQTQIKYDDRIPMEGDELKTGNDPVTEAEMLKLIEALDKIITSDLVGDLLGGLLGAAEGEDFNLGTMIKDLLKGALFTDDFINTVVQMLYPLVLNEFSEVWAGLPQSITYSGINVKVQYQKTLNNILDEGNFEIFPNLLAGKLEEINKTKYADNIKMLNEAGNTVDSWTSPRIVDIETGKLKLTWGVTEQKEKLDAGEITQEDFDQYFYNAFADATSGLLPLLTSLITNVPWSPDSVADIATGNVTIIINISLNVALQLGSEAHSGYADFLVPIYEILGVDYTPVDQINGSKDIAYVLEQILAPIFAFIDKIAEAPVDTILGILPNLVYALAFRMAKPALNMLRTRITYDASANLVGSVMADGADVLVGDMLITNEAEAMLPESMFAGGLNTILAHFGLNIPAIDQATLATLGDLTTMSTNRETWIYDNSAIGAGKAYTIKADKADVGYYLLSYVLNVLKDEAALTSLLSNFMTQKDENGEAILDAAGEKIPDEEAIAKLKETLYNDEGLNFDELNAGNAIAAIVELVNQPEYIVDAYNWYAGEYSSPAGESVAMDIYLNPNNDWTEEKADYLYNNLDSIVKAVLTMAELDLDKEAEGVQNDLGEFLGGTINGLFTNKTVTALAKLLGSISDLNALLAGDEEEGETPDASEPETAAEDEEAAAGLALDLNKIIKDELGIDLSVYAQYAELADDAEVDFGVTDAETFATALANLLAPVKPLLDFILGGKDLTLIDSAITLQGYKGYDNAIIPLLEALGATPAAYTDGADTLALTLNALVARIEALTTGDVIKNVINLLPGILYYISSNGLSQGIDKLLTPVYALLDTIRPIYNLDLGTLLDGIEVDFDKDGVKEPLGLDLKNINWEFIFGLLNDLLGLDLSALQQVIYDVSKSIGVEYDSASALAGTFKKGAYNANFSQADMLTVVLSFILEWATIEGNAKKLDELLKTDGIIASLSKVFEDVEIAYGTPTWYYWFDSEEAFDAYLAGDEALPNTLASLTYPEGNDWTKASAEYFAENLATLVDKVIAMIEINGVKYDNVGALLNSFIAEYISADTINMILDMLKEVLANVDDTLLGVGYLLDVDLVGLKNYTCTAEITTISEFVAELANILDTYAPTIVNLLFFGDDIRLAKKADGTDTIVINGGEGYEKGLALILEALGCELPEEATVANILGALAARVEAILADPVNEVIELLPNLIYFLNANGAGVAVDNILAPVYALLDKINGLGLLDEPIDLADLLGFELKNLTLADILALVESKAGIDLSNDTTEILTTLCLGKIEKGTYTYKMTADKADTITVVLTLAVNLLANEDFTNSLNIDVLNAIKTVFASVPAEYSDVEWQQIGADNKPVDYLNAIYGTDWDRATAEYLAENLPVLVDAVVGLVSEHETLSALLTSSVNIFTTETLNSIVGLLQNLELDMYEEFFGAGIILNVDIEGLMAYTAPEGIDTLDEFAAELANILNTYAKGLVEWLLLGEDYTFFVQEEKVSDDMPYEYNADKAVITLNGANGYSEGLALLLEALGVTAPAVVYVDDKLDTEATLKAVFAAIAARINAIFANPVKEVLALLPNIIYFLNSNGVATVVDNTIAAVTSVLAKLEAFDVKLDINELVNIPKLMGIEDKNASISLDNLTVPAIIEAVGYMLDLDLSRLVEVLNPFAIGSVVDYESISSQNAYKMVVETKEDKADMITVILGAALRVVFENEANTAVIEEMIGTDILTAIKAVFEDVEITYTAPNWDYISEGKDYVVEYPTNWTEETAEYVAAMLPEIADLVAGIIDNNYTSIEALLKDKVNVFTADTLNSIVGLLKDLIPDMYKELLGVGVILDVDINGLLAYECDKEFATINEFAAELASILSTYIPGVIEWLLLGKDFTFFVTEDAQGNLGNMITINGANGYSEGLALLLEALGCQNLPTGKEATDVVIAGVLDSVANLINAIFADPVTEVLALLPNLFYFLNTNGVAAVVGNTIAAVTALLEKLAAFGVELDINALVNIPKLMGIEDKGASISLDNLSMAAILEAVGLMTGLKLGKLEELLVDYNLGKLVPYESVSTMVGEPKKMVYGDEYKVYDMITVIANAALIVFTDKNNAEVVKGLIGEDIYKVIVNFLATAEIEMQKVDWMYTDKVGTVFSAMERSEEYVGFTYGQFYNETHSEYIADNFPAFVDNVIGLLGLEYGKTLDEVLENLIDGTIYKSSNIVAIRDALAGILDGIVNLELGGVNVGTYIAEVLKKAGIADLAAVANVQIPEFAADKAQFIASLCDVIEPLYPILKYVLADEDISFFVAENGTDALVELKGAEGYAYGIIPLLEALGCEGIIAPDAYYAAIDTNPDTLITSIIEPLLNKVDKIIAAPADEILNLLPNLVYFINSNGIDTVVKNTLNAVYAVLAKIEPIAVIDLYELIGVDLAAIDFEWILNKVLELLAGMGYEFEVDEINYVSELTVGKLEKYTSLNGNEAYRMVYTPDAAGAGDKAEMVTTIERLIITFITDEANQDMVVEFLQDNLGMGEAGTKFVEGTIKVLADCAVNTTLGMEMALMATYYVFYGVDTGVQGTVDGLGNLSNAFNGLLDLVEKVNPDSFDLLNKIFGKIDPDGDVFNPGTDGEDGEEGGIAQNGLVRFFQRIVTWFQNIGTWFKNLFSFDFLKR